MVERGHCACSVGEKEGGDGGYEIEFSTLQKCKGEREGEEKKNSISSAPSCATLRVAVSAIIIATLFAIVRSRSKKKKKSKRKVLLLLRDHFIRRASTPYIFTTSNRAGNNEIICEQIRFE